MIPLPHEHLLALAVRRAVLAKGYAFFDGGKPMNLNIVMVRSPQRVANRFDDSMLATYREKEGSPLTCLAAPMTTDPGTYWLKYPMRVEGTAILPPGQYRGAWKVGLHRGKYPALVQAEPFRVYRDRNKDNNLDEGMLSEPDIYHINIHHAGQASTLVEKWSAGCPALAAIRKWSAFWKLVKASEALYGPQFTGTLLTQDELVAALGSPDLVVG